MNLLLFGDIQSRNTRSMEAISDRKSNTYSAVASSINEFRHEWKNSLILYPLLILNILSTHVITKAKAEYSRAVK